MQRLFTTLLLALSLSYALIAQPFDQPTLLVTDTSGLPGQTVCLPVSLHELNGLSTIQGAIAWDTSALAFVGVEVGALPDFSAADLNLEATAAGKLLYSWASLTGVGVSLPDSALLLELCFVIRPGTAPGAYYVALTDQIKPEASINLVEVSLDYHSGWVSVPGAEGGTLSLDFLLSEGCGYTRTDLAAGVSGGTPPYSYEWTGPYGFTSTADTLEALAAAGRYRLTVEDQKGRQWTGTALFTAVNLRGDDTPIAEALITLPSCLEPTGAITLQMASSVTNYSFAWSTGATTDNIDDLPVGLYAVTVTRTSDGCTQERFFDLRPGEQDVVLLANANLILPDCATQSGGSITLIPAFPGLTYQWSTGATSVSVSDLATGNYTVTVTNEAGCTEVRSFELDPPANFDLALAQIDAACGTPSGELTAVVSDGPAGEAYTYAWSTGATTPTIADLGAGTYRVTVTGNIGCVRIDSVTIVQREALLLEGLVSPVSCNNTGEVLLFVAPGVTISWADGSSGNYLEVSEAGDYAVTLTHPSGCMENHTYSVPAYTLPLTPGFQRVTNSRCTEPSGSIQLDYSNDPFEYSYIWSDGPSGTASMISRTELPPGDYEVVLFLPFFGCVDTLTYTVGTETDFELNSEVTPLICETPGMIQLSGAAAATFDYQWSTGDTTAGIEVLTPGDYTVTVTTPIGCQKILNETVPELTETPEWEVVTVESPSCNAQDGTIILNLGETTTAIWNLGLAGPELNNLPAGTYEAYLTTPNGCRDTVPFTLEADGVLDSEPATVEITNADCDGQGGAISVVFPSGEDLSYSWSTGASTATLTGLTTGDYGLTVSNAAGCTATFSHTIEEAAGFTIEIAAEPIVCDDPGSLTAVASGSADYSYLWSTGATTATISVAAAGSYAVTVTDPATGCERSVARAIEAPVVPRIESIDFACALTNTCAGTVPVELILSGGSGELTVTWSDGAFAQVTAGLAGRPLVLGTSYAVTVTDAAGCTAFAENILADCASPAEVRVVYYLECELDTTVAEPELKTFLVAEVLSSTSVHAFAWSDGQTDTSYYRSRRPLAALAGPLGLTVTSALGAATTLDIAVADLEPCAATDNALRFTAPHVTVTPGTSLRYPVRVSNYAGKTGVQTLTWDNCRFDLDSAYVYTYPLTGPARVEVTESVLAGYNEFVVAYADLGNNPAEDSLLVLELYLTARPESEGVSPVLFTDTDAELVVVEHGSITVSGPEQLVRPGDANRDAAVNQLDLLYLGLAYAATGPDRRRRLLSEPEYAPAWDLQTPASALNLRHTDPDGDGRVAAADTLLLGLNWTSGDLGPGDVDTTGGVPLYVAADTLAPNTSFRIPVFLGDQDRPATDVYGLATTLTWEGDGLVGDSLRLDFSGSWLTDALTYAHSAQAEHRIDFALVGRDGQDRSGNGPVAWISGRTTAVAGATIDFRFGDTRLMNAAEGFFAVSPRATLVAVDNPVATLDPALAGQLVLYPVPATDRLYLQTPARLRVDRLTVLGIDGRRLFSQGGDQPLEVGHLPAGVYLLRVRTDQGTVTLRWVRR